MRIDNFSNNLQNSTYNGSSSAIKSLQRQLKNKQQELEKLGQNKQLSEKDKELRRKAIQEEIANLQTQLQQKQLEQSREGAKANSAQNGRKTDGAQNVLQDNMQKIIAADNSVKLLQTQKSAAESLEGRTRTLKAEINTGRGNIEDKKAQLDELTAKANGAKSAYMSNITENAKNANSVGIYDENGEKKNDEDDDELGKYIDETV